MSNKRRDHNRRKSDVVSGRCTEPGTDISLGTECESSEKAAWNEILCDRGQTSIPFLVSVAEAEESRWACEEHGWIVSKRGSEEQRSTTRGGQMIFDRSTVARHRDYRATEFRYVYRLPCRRTAVRDAHRRSVTTILS